MEQELFPLILVTLWFLLEELLPQQKENVEELLSSCYWYTNKKKNVDEHDQRPHEDK